MVHFQPVSRECACVLEGSTTDTFDLHTSALVTCYQTFVIQLAGQQLRPASTGWLHLSNCFLVSLLTEV